MSEKAGYRMNEMIGYSNRRVLCVDDEQNVLGSLQRMLRGDFQIHTALNGKEALEKISQLGPFSVVITDHNMPGMTGLQLLQQVHKVAPETMLIMLTGITELGVVIHAVNETNIFRFLAKPCQPHLLKATINEAIEQYHLRETQHRLTAELAATHAELLTQKQELEYQLAFAQTIFGKIFARNEGNRPELDIYMSPMESVGGDLILSAQYQQETLYVLLGDVTGHGLPAAIASMLIADTFTALSAEHCDIEMMAQGINHKISQSLPTGLFCAALLVQFDFNTQQLSVWQGGLPDAYLFNQQGDVIETIRSNNFALGILANQNFSGTATHYKNQDISAVLAYSDGLTEQTNPEQEMFGEQRLLSCLKNVPSHLKRVDLIQQLKRFSAGCSQSDDLSLFELNIANLRQFDKSQ